MSGIRPPPKLRQKSSKRSTSLLKLLAATSLVLVGFLSARSLPGKENVGSDFILLLEQQAKILHEDKEGVGYDEDPVGMNEIQKGPATIKADDNDNRLTTIPTAAAAVVLDGFRQCRVDPAPIVGEKQIEMDGLAMPVEYQCAGEPYDQFATQLEKIIHHKSNTNLGWGRRKRLLPYQSTGSPGRSILIMGNSHTRQLVSTLACQFQDRLVDPPPEMLYSMPQYPSYGVLKINFANNVTLYSATNCPFIYSPSWPQTMADILGMPSLASLTTIVMGRFNDYNDSTGTNFRITMMDYQQQFPQFNIDFEHSQTPLLSDVAKVYPGPLVYVGGFSKYSEFRVKQANKQLLVLKEKRNNLHVIDGRKYIQELWQTMSKTSGKHLQLLPVQECSSDERTIVATCVINTTSIRFDNGHRCMGSRGGHPDLVAWDLIEVLYKLLKKKV